MLWVDPTDPDVFAAVAALEEPIEDPSPEDQALISSAVSIASEILTMATGFKVHPAGEITEQFQAWGRRPRFTLLWGPVLAVSKVARVLSDDSEQTVTFHRIGQLVQLPGRSDGYSTSGYFPLSEGFHGSLPLWRTNWSTGSRESRWRVTYTFADTITPAAKQSILTFAHEFYLLLIGNTEDCQLPQRVTSIDREGLGIQLATPADFLDKGRTGIDSIDNWLAQVNRYQASRPSQVFTPDSPPGIGTGMRRLP